MNNRKKTSRRDFLKVTLVGSGAVVLNACAATPVTQEGASPSTAASAPASSSTAASASTSASPSAAASAGEFILGTTPGSPTHAKGWTTNVASVPQGLPYNRPITITSGRNVGDLTFAQGDDVNNNPFTRFAKQQLGIEWKTKFTWTQGDERDQKYNLALASGDLPDFLEAVPASIFANMVEAGALEDITDVWERTASPKVKELLSYNNNLAWSICEVNGRKLGLPFTEKVAQNDKVLWVRQDWLDKVGMAAPKTLDELGQVAKAFKDQNLGQGASGTTVGLLACKGLNIWYGSLDPVFGAYGVVPGYWVKTSDGNLGYGSVQPATKDVLALLQQWYKDGIIAQDFDTKEPWEQQQKVAGNQCGLHFSPFFGASYGAAESIKNDPNAKWVFVDIPAGPTGKKGKAWSPPFSSALVHAFRKGFPHVDAVIQQMNWLAEWADVPNASRFHGWEGYNYTWEGDTTTPADVSAPLQWAHGPVGNLANNGVDVQRGAKDEQIALEWKNLPTDQLDAAQESVVNDPDGTLTLQREAYIFLTKISEEQGIKNEFVALPTATMKERQTDLDTLEQTQMFGIIKGDLPIDAFDEFVTNWKSQGGDQITQEVNEWYSSQKTS